MCEHRTAQCVAGYVNMLRHCGGTTGPLDLLRTKPHLLDLCRWMSIRLVQCLDFRLARTGKENRRGKGKSKDGKGNDKGKKGDKSKDQKPMSKPEQFQGYCRYCDKWRHKRVDCRKRIADPMAKGGAAAASADDGDVAVVMEVDDVVMRTGGDETSTGWCFALSVLLWDQQVLSSWTAEVTNTCALRNLQI